MSKASKLLELIYESNSKLKVGATIPYYDANAIQKFGKIKVSPTEGKGTLELENGIILTYNQFESWWEQYVKGKKPDSSYIDKIYSQFDSPDLARSKDLSPFINK